MRVMVHEWAETPSHIFPKISEQRADIELVSTHDKECDLLIVHDRNKIPIDTRCPKGCAWLLAYEPPVECYDYYRDYYNYFDLVHTEVQDIPTSFSGSIIHEKYPLMWCINKTFAELEAITINGCTNKQDKVSAVISSAKNLPGHILRHKLLEYFNKSQLPLDHYGIGYNYIPDKFNALFPYKYSIGIENSSFHNYCTDKIADCLLSLTMPIYWGCPNILEFFPKESMILVDSNDLQGSVEMIEEAVATDLWSKNIDAIIYARDLVLHKYSFYPFMCNLIDKYYTNQTSLENIHIPAMLSPKERKLSTKIKKLLGVYKIKKSLKKKKLHRNT